MLPVIEQRHTVPAPAGAVIAGLSDPAVLRAAIPRCRDVRKLSDSKLWVAADIGVLRWTFQVEGVITLQVQGAQVTLGSDLRTRAFRLGHAETVLNMTETAGKTVIVSVTTLTPARNHSLIIRRAGVAVARQLLGSFFQNFRPPLSA